MNETINSANSMFQSYISSYGITVVDAGTQDSTLTIPAGADTALNGVVVECSVFGKIDDVIYDESESSTLYIIGML